VCGVTHKTVRRVVDAPRSVRSQLCAWLGAATTIASALLVTELEETLGKISAKQLLPTATAAGCEGSARNFQRLVAQARVWVRGG